MDIYKAQIEQIVHEQKLLLEKYTSEHNKCMYGNLARVNNNGKVKYYHTFIRDGRYHRLTIGEKPDLVKALARKEYLSVATNVLKHNIKVMERAESHLINYDFDLMKGKMQKAYWELPYEFFFDSDMPGIYSVGDLAEKIKRHIEWGKEPYEKSMYKPERLKHPTSAGFKVRSKSEQHIVEQLVNYGIPFRYEQIIRVNDRTFAPDFTFRGRNFDYFYWEHAGMMGDEFYRTRHKRKMELMERGGIVPWENLIATYDVDEEINVPMIKSIIENDVIPRL